MGRVFWIVIGLCVMAAVHLATVLYLPGIVFRHNLAQLAADAKANTFFVMKPEKQSALVPTASAEDIVGICMLNFSKGVMSINAHVPRSLWNFAIYSGSGQQIYGINDVQAGGDSFTVDVARAKSLLQQLTGKPEAEDATQMENVGWHAEIGENRGIAVLWVPVADPVQRPALQKLVAESRCAAK